MADTITLDVVTPEARLVHAEVSEIVAQGILGQFGVLPGHANFVGALEPGPLTYEEGGDERTMAVAGGFVEITLEEGIKIMADAAEFAEKIDAERAEAAKERAERRISDYDPSTQETDIVRAEAALARALVRLQVSKNFKD